MKLISTAIPYPPSVNAFMKRTKKGGMMLTDKARNYKRDVKYLLHNVKPKTPSTSRLSGRFTIHAPTKRKYDLDNRMKMILDALEDADIFDNDEQFDEIIIKRGEVIKGGIVEVEINEIESNKS